jgi:hypothetical protein
MPDGIIDVSISSASVPSLLPDGGFRGGGHGEDAGEPHEHAGRGQLRGALAERHERGHAGVQHIEPPRPIGRQVLHDVHDDIARGLEAQVRRAGILVELADSTFSASIQVRLANSTPRGGGKRTGEPPYFCGFSTPYFCGFSTPYFAVFRAVLRGFSTPYFCGFSTPYFAVFPRRSSSVSPLRFSTQPTARLPCLLPQ